MKNLLVGLLALTLCATAFASPKKHVFDGRLDDVFNAAVKSAQSNWSVKFADRQTLTITFTSGISVTSNGMECSAVLKQTGDSKVEVTLQTHKKLQAYAWGAGGRIAEKFFKGIDEQLVNSKTETHDGKSGTL